MSTTITSYKRRGFWARTMRFLLVNVPALASALLISDYAPNLAVIIIFVLGPYIAKGDNWAEWEKIEGREE